MSEPKDGKDHPLTCELVGDELVIRVGVDVIAFAAENNQHFFDYDIGIVVVSHEDFAKDVVSALTEEDELGKSILTKAVDDACIKAFEDGSTGCDGLDK